MSRLALENVNPLTLTSHLDEHGHLRLAHGNTVLQDEDAIALGLSTPAKEGMPRGLVCIMDPAPDCALEVRHQEGAHWVTWDRFIAGNTRTWGETSQQHRIVATLPVASGTTKATIYIEVKPVEDLPDR